MKSVTVPGWVWAVTAAGLIAVVTAEITLSRHGSFTTRRAVRWIAVYVSLAVLFGLAVGIAAGWLAAGQFYAGYLTEYSLSLDNLFIFYVIMGWFAVPAGRQHRVLLLGIGLALALRSVLIVAVAAALNRFGWLFYPLGGILVWTAIGLITGSQALLAREREILDRYTDALAGLLAQELRITQGVAHLVFGPQISFPGIVVAASPDQVSLMGGLVAIVGFPVSGLGRGYVVS